jgi:hypothetical protein
MPVHLPCSALFLCFFLLVCFNVLVAALKNNARGFHRFDSFRTRILFFLGDLDLQPR